MAVRRRARRALEMSENHEINVTPFIDVVLVLLIVFMIAAPLATVDVNVDLPDSTAAPIKRPDRPIVLTLKKDATLRLGDDLVQQAALIASLDRLTEKRRETRIYLHADRDVDYGALMALINRLQLGGYLKIALVGREAVSPLLSRSMSE